MSPKKLKFLICAVIFVVLVASINIISGTFEAKKQIEVRYRVEQADNFQLFYKVADDIEGPYTEENSLWSVGEATEKTGRMVFSVPENAVWDSFRLDIGWLENNTVTIEEMQIWDGRTVYSVEADDLGALLEQNKIVLQNTHVTDRNEQYISFQNETTDPSLEFFMHDIQEVSEPSRSFLLPRAILSIALSVLISLALTYVIYRVVYLRDLIDLAVGVGKNKRLIVNMAMNDFRAHYAGSYFGRIWAFVQPLCTIVIYWFVFDIGLHSSSMSDLPFSLWLTAGLIPWLFFTEAWSGMTNVFLEYSYLVKKVVFELDIMPLIKLISSLFTHLIFIVIMAIIYTAYGYMPSLWAVQILYYTFAMCCYVMALSFMTASFMVFVRDTVQVMNIIMQFSMWLTPILWHVSIFPASFEKYFRINPMYYIVQGYRDCMVADHFVLFSDFRWALYFWLFTGILICMSISIFRRLKVHFADVL